MNEGASGGRSIALTNDHYQSPAVRDTPLTFSQQNFIKPDRTLPITHGPPMFFQVAKMQRPLQLVRDGLILVHTTCSMSFKRAALLGKAIFDGVLSGTVALYL